MKAIVIMAPLLASGCNPVANDFEVRAPDAESAELHLCGKVTSLERSGHLFKTRRPIDCEGAGAITVQFRERPSVTCPIGYVTPGMALSFRLKVEDDLCVSSEA